MVLTSSVHFFVFERPAFGERRAKTYLFKLYFCGNWPIFVFVRRNHTRAKTQRARKLFLDPTRTMVSKGNGPLPRCVVGVWPKLGHRRPLHIGGHQRCARSWYPPLPSLSFCRLSTMVFCVTEFFGHDKGSTIEHSNEFV